jgi:hypothetical protein
MLNVDFRNVNLALKKCECMLSTIYAIPCAVSCFVSKGLKMKREKKTIINYCKPVRFPSKLGSSHHIFSQQKQYFNTIHTTLFASFSLE